MCRPRIAARGLCLLRYQSVGCRCTATAFPVLVFPVLVSLLFPEAKEHLFGDDQKRQKESGEGIAAARGAC